MSTKWSQLSEYFPNILARHWNFLSKNFESVINDSSIYYNILNYHDYQELIRPENIFQNVIIRENWNETSQEFKNTEDKCTRK